MRLKFQKAQRISSNTTDNRSGANPEGRGIENVPIVRGIVEDEMNLMQERKEEEQRGDRIK